MWNQGGRGLMLAGPHTLEWVHSSLLVDRGRVSSLHSSPHCNVGASRDSLEHSWSVLMSQVMTQKSHTSNSFPSEKATQHRQNKHSLQELPPPVPTFRGPVWERCLNTGLKHTVSRQVILCFIDSS